MSDLTELVADGRVDLRVTMPMYVAPETAHTVEILAAVDVDQRAALSPFEKQRLVLGHLSEGVPDDLAIPAIQIFASGCDHSDTTVSGTFAAERATIKIRDGSECS